MCLHLVIWKNAADGFDWCISKTATQHRSHSNTLCRSRAQLKKAEACNEYRLLRAFSSLVLFFNIFILNVPLYSQFFAAKIPRNTSESCRCCRGIWVWIFKRRGCGGSWNIVNVGLSHYRTLPLSLGTLDWLLNTFQLTQQSIVLKTRLRQGCYRDYMPIPSAQKSHQ